MGLCYSAVHVSVGTKVKISTPPLEAREIGPGVHRDLDIRPPVLVLRIYLLHSLNIYADPVLVVRTDVVAEKSPW